MLRKMFRNKKGQGLVEYALIIAGVALIAAVGVSVFGHKVSDMIAATAAVLPGAHEDDNAGIESGKLIEASDTDADGAIQLDVGAIATASGTARLENNVLGLGSAAGSGTDFGGLVVEANE